MADLAEKRREIRRLKILANQESRMKKITGQTEGVSDPLVEEGKDFVDKQKILHESEEIMTSESSINNETNEVTDMLNGIKHQDKCSHNFPKSPINETLATESVSSVHESNGHSSDVPLAETQDMCQPESDSVQKMQTTSGFQELHFCLCILAAVLVRISLFYNFGVHYVQTIIYPFVTLEIALYGYLFSSGKQMGVTLSGGMWTTIFQMCGFDPQLVHTYKVIMTMIQAISADFAAYFFSFICTHMLCSALYG